MDIQPPKPDEEFAETLTSQGVDQQRRRLSSGGAIGTAVLLSLTSRSAMGGWGGCTGSEIASGNLSRAGTPNPCGCSPGYWWSINGFATWDKYLLAYPRSTSMFNVVFGRTYFNPDVRLSACGPGTSNPRAHFPTTTGLDNVAMHAVAALFNATFYGARYPVTGLQSSSAVIAAFQTAFDANTAQALKDFCRRVDVYDSMNTWCNGEPHSGV